jgi:hypothetical protein
LGVVRDYWWNREKSVLVYVELAFTGCGKIPKVTFRGRGLPEESAFFLGLVRKQIPRFARDDIEPLFSTASLAEHLPIPNCPTESGPHKNASGRLLTDRVDTLNI